MLSYRWTNRIAGALSCLLLLGAAADRASLAPPVDPTAYHARIADVAKRLSWTQGEWSAVEDERAERVGSWIHASVFMNWRLTNALSGHSVNLLIEHCDDARDLIPHFPGVCYPAQGMITAGTWDRVWNVGDVSIEGREYIFDRSSFQSGGAIIVDNFMVLPTGQFCRDMNEVKHKLPLSDRFVGLGQFQIVMSASVPRQQRERDFAEILSPCCDLVNSMLHGPGPGS